MTERDAVDDVIDRFGRKLQQAELRVDRARRPRRKRRLVLAGAGLAVAGSAAALVIGTIGSGSRLDVVGEAQAALAPEGTILHVKIAYGRPGQPDDPSTPEIRETWSASSPNRWKYVQVTPFVRWSQGKAHPTNQTQTEEFAFAGGTLSDYRRRENTLTTMAGYPESGPTTVPLTWPGMPAGQDPVATLRSWLASGRLESAGPMKLSGRSVLRLRGTSVAQMDRGVPALRVEYDVDATTFVPVRMVVGADASDSDGARAVLWFRAFERLPLTPENEALLTVDPAPNARIERYRLPIPGRPCKDEKKNGHCPA